MCTLDDKMVARPHQIDSWFTSKAFLAIAFINVNDVILHCSATFSAYITHQLTGQAWLVASDDYMSDY